MSITGPMKGAGSAKGSSTIIRSSSFWIASSSSLFVAVFHDQPAGRGAALSSAEIGGLDDDDRRRLDILGVPDDQRIVAAKLKREDLLRCFRELAVERLARAGRSGEQQAVDPGLGGERADPASGPPISRRTTPSGILASWKQRTRNSPTAGVFSDGLKTIALPAISAGTIWPLGRCAGKLYGPSTASTPCGLCRTAILLPSAASSFRCGDRSA